MKLIPKLIKGRVTEKIIKGRMATQIARLLKVISVTHNAYGFQTGIIVQKEAK